jgi:hypothetical protein
MRFLLQILATLVVVSNAAPAAVITSNATVTCGSAGAGETNPKFSRCSVWERVEYPPGSGEYSELPLEAEASAEMLPNGGYNFEVKGFAAPYSSSMASLSTSFTLDKPGTFYWWYSMYADVNSSGGTSQTWIAIGDLVSTHLSSPHGGYQASGETSLGVTGMPVFISLGGVGAGGPYRVSLEISVIDEEGSGIDLKIGEGPEPVPEPATLVGAALGLAGIAAKRRSMFKG